MLPHHSDVTVVDGICVTAAAASARRRASAPLLAPICSAVAPLMIVVKYSVAKTLTDCVTLAVAAALADTLDCGDSEAEGDAATLAHALVDVEPLPVTVADTEVVPALLSDAELLSVADAETVVVPLGETAPLGVAEIATVAVVLDDRVSDNSEALFEAVLVAVALEDGAADTLAELVGVGSGAPPAVVDGLVETV